MLRSKKLKLGIDISLTVLILALITINGVADSNQNGLHASYYNNPIYWNNVNAIATPDVQRIDPNIDFDWRSFGRNDPLPSGITEDDAWSVDWTGFINIPSDGTYWFDLNSDDGSWLFIDGKLIIENDGGDHPPRDKYNSIYLTKGYHQHKR